MTYLEPQITIKDLLSALQFVRKQDKSVRSEEDIYFDEYSVLCRGSTDGDEEYSAIETAVPSKYEPFFEKIIAVDKLTETQALCGFTRSEPWNGKDLTDSRIVPLSTEQKDCLPAIQRNGSGIFIKFRTDSVKEWVANTGLRYTQMKKANSDSYLYNAKYSAEYVLLHSFAHLFIRQLANECGYLATGIKEKIYTAFTDEGFKHLEMYGVLIYLLSSEFDRSSECFSSLVKSTRYFESFLNNMLQQAFWCPECASKKRCLSQNFVACRNCIFIPEQMCEFRNEFLDRVAVVGTPDDRTAGLFANIVSNMDYNTKQNNENAGQNCP